MCLGKCIYVVFLLPPVVALHPSDIPQVNIMPPTPQASNLTPQALRQTPGEPGSSDLAQAASAQPREHTVMAEVAEEDSDDGLSLMFL